MQRRGTCKHCGKERIGLSSTRDGVFYCPACDQYTPVAIIRRVRMIEFEE